MDHAHARNIATSAEKVRPSLDASASTRLRTLAGVLVFVALVGIFPGFRAWLLTYGITDWGVNLFLGVVVLPAVIIASWASHRRARRRLDEAREKMLCPHCPSVLREDGPAHWQTCDETARLCPSCSETITDEVYAAAALPTLRGELSRRANRRPGWLALFTIPLALYLGFAAVNQPATAWLESRGHEHADLAMIVLLAALCVVVPSVTLLIVLSLRRSVNLAAARWLDAPFCPRCDERFPDGALDSTILRCESCDTRMSTAVGIFDSLAARATVGQQTPVPWPRGQQTPPALSGESQPR